MKAMRIGGRLRRLRQERHLTQAQMARELGISASYLTLIESNQRPVTVRILLRLVERFQVDLSEFAGLHEHNASEACFIQYNACAVEQICLEFDAHNRAVR